MQGRLKAAYEILNTHLKGREWIVGDSITNADISCCGYLFYPETLRFRPQGLAQYRPVAFEHRKHPRLETPLRPDARLPRRPGLTRRTT